MAIWGRVGSKADPKDGDFHGDPTRPITHEETFGQTASGDERGTAGGAGNGTGPSADATDQPRPNPLTPMALRPSIRSSKT